MRNRMPTKASTYAATERLFDPFRYAPVWVILLAIALSNPGNLIGRPQENRLMIEDVHYEQGMVSQLTTPLIGQGINAEWKARFVEQETGEIVCSGGGDNDYLPRFRPVFMEPNFWVGQPDCVLVNGQAYFGVATWSWFDSEGQAQSVTHHFGFVHEHQDDFPEWAWGYGKENVGL